MNQNKKAEFGIVIGFMFSFFIVTSVIIGSFYLYQKQLTQQTEILQNAEELNGLSSIKTSFTLQNPYVQGGRTFLKIENTGLTTLQTKEKENSCFDIFLNNQFFDQFSYKLQPDYTLAGRYSILEEKESGFLSYLTTSLSGTLKVNSCNGVIVEYPLSLSKQNWFDEDYQNRTQFAITGSSFSDVYEYQIPLEINSSNVDLSLFSTSDMLFKIPLTEYEVLTLPFDRYSQTPNEFANGYSTTLGANSLSGVDDPSEEKLAPLYSGLQTNGSQFVRVTSMNGLDGSSEATLSFWIKPTSLSVGQMFISIPNLLEVELGSSQTSNPQDVRVLWTYDTGVGTNTTFSNVLTQNTWQHITITLSSGTTCMYKDGSKISCNTELNKELLNTPNANLDIAPSYVGSLDEITFYDIALEETDISELPKGKLWYVTPSYYTYFENSTEIKLYVKMPKLRQSKNTTLQLYYNSETSIPLSSSDIFSTFTYHSPRLVGMLGHSKLASTNGIAILSLFDNSTIQIDSTIYNLNKQQATFQGTVGLAINTTVKLTYPAQVEGDGDVDDVIVPISWAGTEFHYRGFRNGNDQFCMISPWGIANVQILDGGSVEYTGTVNGTGSCIINDITTANTGSIISDIPIIVSYAGSNQDSFVLYPATAENLYGVPSQTLYLASGPLGASGTYYESSGASTGFTFGAYGNTNSGGNGADGNSNGFKIVSDNLVGAIQEADGDGSEATVFVPEKEFGTVFGSSHDTDYVAVVSNDANANCTMYDNLGSPIATIASGTGTNGVYTYHFGVGNDNLYASGNWMLECSKPVWPYYENRVDNGDETNLFSYAQMRQYVYPEPQISKL
jgi:hypothetical protein